MPTDSALVMLIICAGLLAVLIGPLSLSVYFALVGSLGQATFFIVLQAMIWWLFN